MSPAPVSASKPAAWPSRKELMWVVLPVLGLLYTFSQIMRTYFGLVVVDLETELGLRSWQTGMLGGILFLSYGIAQVPCGLILDRFGAPRVLPISAILLTISTAVFATSTTFAELAASRFLMGLSIAPILAGSLLLFANDERPQTFGMVSSVMMMLGRGGMVLATLPLAAMLAHTGLKGGFLWLAAVGFVISLAVFAILFPAFRQRAQASGGWGPSIDHLRRAVGSRGLFPILFFQASTSAGYTTILTLLAAPWLKSGYGMGATQRSWMLLALAVSMAAGTMAWARVLGMGQGFIWAVLAGAIATAALLVIAGSTHLPAGTLVPWLVALGLFSAYYSVVLVQTKALLPAGAAVHGITLLNTGAMLGIFFAQVLTGVIVDRFPGVPGHHPPEAYRAAFLFLAAFQIMGIAVYWWVFGRGAGKPAAASSR